MISAKIARNKLKNSIIDAENKKQASIALAKKETLPKVLQEIEKCIHTAIQFHQDNVMFNFTSWMVADYIFEDVMKTLSNLGYKVTDKSYWVSDDDFEFDWGLVATEGGRKQYKCHIDFAQPSIKTNNPELL